MLFVAHRWRGDTDRTCRPWRYIHVHVSRSRWADAGTSQPVFDWGATSRPTVMETISPGSFSVLGDIENQGMNQEFQLCTPSTTLHIISILPSLLHYCSYIYLCFATYLFIYIILLPNATLCYCEHCIFSCKSLIKDSQYDCLVCIVWTT